MRRPPTARPIWDTSVDVMGNKFPAKIIKIYSRIFIYGLAFIILSHPFALAQEAIQNLRIGTPGDYFPYSHLNTTTNQYEGLDIDLIRNFAHTYNFNSIFVPTTWKTLLSDLENNKFDIAIGGITSTKIRKQKAFITQPYNLSQKSLLFLCELKFKTLSDIDKYNIKVLENIGGTNEQFAKKHIKHAQLIFKENNNTVLDILIKHQADVMITDSEEALWAHKNNHELCVSMTNLAFTKSKKVFLVSKQEHMLFKTLNVWMQDLKNAGVLENLKSKWLN